MGREIRRVPMDFQWPMDKPWKGFLMPDHLREDQCSACEGDGYSREARAIANTFYPSQISNDYEEGRKLAWNDKIGQAEVDNLQKEGRLRTWKDGEWHDIPRLAAEVNAANRRGGMLHDAAHDAINRMILVEFRCKVLGIPKDCPVCEGHGYTEVYPGQRAEAEAWESEEPPRGDGWQLWETVSEGSPISPVFATPEELATWLSSPAASKWHSNETSYERWLKFIKGSGWAPSMVMDGVMQSGVDFVASREEA